MKCSENVSNAFFSSTLHYKMLDLFFTSKSELIGLACLKQKQKKDKI